ncbi:hypothetical protein [Pseudoalteromonas sp. SWXJZ10B]|uniref:hypothetical protein n=1 Tax=Pseudoalteromonas sp. SWXJZ10B TaxID=2792063 RepID=UPI0018CF8ED9|nr:hypothetical protein [Pseudoalteromonas sp. SWXJZ10B]MBH0042066.1 hypothetical protein [Pseudoalteromonas sp. SWXJZ10B]
MRSHLNKYFMAVYFSKAQCALNPFVNKPYYELCSSRQQAVRLQVNLTTVLNFAAGLSLKSAARS